MPLSDVHKKNKKKNIVVLAVILLFIALVWALTMVKIANADEMSDDTNIPTQAFPDIDYSSAEKPVAVTAPEIEAPVMPAAPFVPVVSSINTSTQKPAPQTSHRFANMDVTGTAPAAPSVRMTTQRVPARFSKEMTEGMMTQEPQAPNRTNDPFFASSLEAAANVLNDTIYHDATPVTQASPSEYLDEGDLPRFIVDSSGATNMNARPTSQMDTSLSMAPVPNGVRPPAAFSDAYSHAAAGRIIPNIR